MTIETEQADIVAAAGDEAAASFTTSLAGAGRAAHDQARSALAAIGTMKQRGLSEVAGIQSDLVAAAELASRGGHEAATMARAQAADRQARADLQLAADHAAARLQIDVLEASLISSIVPTPSKDPGVQGLARGELTEATKGLSGAALVPALLNLVGVEDEITAQALTFGRRLLERSSGDSRTAEVLWRSLLLQATQKLAAAAGPGTAPASAGAALLKIDRLRGAADAARSSIQLRGK